MVSTLARDGRKGGTQWWRFWPLLLPPLAVASVYVLHATGGQAVLNKRGLEWAALVILPLAAVAFGYRAARRRDHLSTLLCSLALVFFLREWHFSGTSVGVYVALGVLGVWTWAWRVPVGQTLSQHPRLLLWLFATTWAYLASQLIARRVFRFLPDEDILHVEMEEWAEVLAHVMLAVIALVMILTDQSPAEAETAERAE